MNCQRRAVIDVGTNSIKLLVGELSEAGITPVLERSHQTRLGEGFYPAHVLQAGPLAKSARVVADFAAQARELGAERVRIVATSAAREALNREELKQVIEQACGLPVRVLTGEEEAHYGFLGVTSDPRLAREPLFVLDVGGGSTEITLGLGREEHFAKSFGLGTVRLFVELQLSDPPDHAQLSQCRSRVLRILESEAAPAVLPALKLELNRSSRASDGMTMVGTGGTASMLGCMETGLNSFDRERLERTSLSRDRVRWHVAHLWQLTLEQRKTVVGLPPNRADVILTGVVIYESVMSFFDLKELRISTRGLRYGLILEQD